MIPHSRPQPSPDALQALQQALGAIRLTQGPEVQQLEAELEILYPDCFAVCVSSGTAALYLALQGLHLPRGAEVVIPSYTCNALYAAVAHAGSQAVCADTEPGVPVLTPQSVQAVCSPRTGAVIVPHPFGFSAPVEAIRRITGLPVIEDCAQALGLHQQPGHAFTGELAVLSFFATKMIPGCEGGAVITRDPGTAAEIRRLRDCDEADPDPRAFNFKMSDLHAALIRSQLKHLNEILDRRSQIAARYDREWPGLSLPERAARQPVCFRYLIQTPDDAESGLALLRENGIGARHPLWRPLHETLGGTCPETERLHRCLISIPAYPALTEAELAHIIQTVKAWFHEHSKQQP